MIGGDLRRAGAEPQLADPRRPLLQAEAAERRHLIILRIVDALQQYRRKLLIDRFVPLVAGRGGIREVVGNHIRAVRLSDHAGRRDIQATQHGKASFIIIRMVRCTRMNFPISFEDISLPLPAMAASKRPLYIYPHALQKPGQSVCALRT